MMFAFLTTSPCYFYSESEQQREESGKQHSACCSVNCSRTWLTLGLGFHPQGDTELTQVPASVQRIPRGRF